MSANNTWFFGGAALLALALLVAALTRIDAFLPDEIGLPPVESLTVERTEMADHRFSLLVRADGAQTMRIAQLMVDGAFWTFEQDPTGAIDRGDAAWIHIAYPWVANETHHIRFVTSAGATFDHTIDVALSTPTYSGALFLHYAILGVLVGVVPIAFGMLFYPALRNLGESGLQFVLALTVGLLAYLIVDMTLDGLELASTASAMFGGAALVLIPMLFTFIALSSFARSHPREGDGIRVALLIALGIGAHNFGEGLAIGAAFSNNKAAVGAFLIVGFTLHNITEGLGLVAPLIRERVRLPLFTLLALVAGLPAVPGIWLGAWSLSPHWGAVFFGIGAGAIAQVIVEIDRFSRRRGGDERARVNAVSVAGYGSGLVIMYVTALLIAI